MRDEAGTAPARPDIGSISPSLTTPNPPTPAPAPQVYYVTIVACNAVGQCTNRTSPPTLVDTTPPLLSLTAPLPLEQLEGPGGEGLCYPCTGPLTWSVSVTEDLTDLLPTVDIEIRDPLSPGHATTVSLAPVSVGPSRVSLAAFDVECPAYGQRLQLRVVAGNAVRGFAATEARVVGSAGAPDAAAAAPIRVDDVTPLGLTASYVLDEDELGIVASELRVTDLTLGAHVGLQRYSTRPNLLVFTAVTPLAHWHDHLVAVRVENRCGGTSAWVNGSVFRPDFTAPTVTAASVFFEVCCCSRARVLGLAHDPPVLRVVGDCRGLLRAFMEW